jgi:hypothetical protein
MAKQNRGGQRFKNTALKAYLHHDTLDVNCFLFTFPITGKPATYSESVISLSSS